MDTFKHTDIESICQIHSHIPKHIVKAVCIAEFWWEDDIIGQNLSKSLRKMLIFTSWFHPLYAQLRPKVLNEKSLGRFKIIKKVCLLCRSVLLSPKNGNIFYKFYFEFYVGATKITCLVKYKEIKQCKECKCISQITWCTGYNNGLSPRRPGFDSWHCLWIYFKSFHFFLIIGII